MRYSHSGIRLWPYKKEASGLDDRTGVHESSGFEFFERQYQPRTEWFTAHLSIPLLLDCSRSSWVIWQTLYNLGLVRIE